ncbi:unnamed protein product [Leuciscus chuanchicus]
MPMCSPEAAPVLEFYPQGALLPTLYIESTQASKVPTEGATVPAKTPQGAPVPESFPDGGPMPKHSSEGSSMCSPQGAPMTECSPQRASVSTGSTQGAVVPKSFSDTDKGSLSKCTHTKVFPTGNTRA